MGFTRIICWTVMYALFSIDGMIVPESTQTTAIFGLLRKMLNALRTVNHTIEFKDSEQTFLLNMDMMLDFCNDAVPCASDEENITLSDGDYLKHAINHFQIMLL